MKTTCIIGAGITGLLLVLLLEAAGADMSKITLIDPFFDGGDLARKWTTVLSNTPWSKTMNSLQQHFPSLSIDSSTDPSTNTPLIEIAHLIRNLAETALKKMTLVQGTVASANYSTETNEWIVQVITDGAVKSISVKQLILAPGAEPKTMNLGIPSIPLDVALDSQRLKCYIQPGKSVLVFGTMHSGSLVIKNLVSLGANVTAYYNSPNPFYWDRDGSYDGIKGEAATIADDIVAGTLPVTLVSTKDTASVIRTSREAQWVVYAFGLARRNIKLLLNGIELNSVEYNEHSGRITGVPAWGFGVAYPNRAPDGIHWDVGVAPFLNHIKPQIPDIVSDII
jgi:hypothetical protein